MKERGNRKIKSGIVVSNKMAKTAVVRVERAYNHPLYGKVLKSVRKYYAHDEEAATLKPGDKVSIVECRPRSKLKRWRIVRESR